MPFIGMFIWLYLWDFFFGFMIVKGTSKNIYSAIYSFLAYFIFKPILGSIRFHYYVYKFLIYFRWVVDTWFCFSSSLHSIDYFGIPCSKSNGHIKLVKSISFLSLYHNLLCKYSSYFFTEYQLPKLICLLMSMKDFILFATTYAYFIGWITFQVMYAFIM